MKLVLQNKSGENVINVMRQAGYFFLGKQGEELNFVKQVGSAPYPRFHVYLKGDEINLHFDQKKPVYKGQTAHSGEYDSEVLEKEMLRMRQFYEKQGNC